MCLPKLLIHSSWNVCVLLLVMSQPAFAQNEATTIAPVISFLLADPEPPKTALKINELDYDNVGSDDSEFIEIFNTGPDQINLNGVSIVRISGDSGSTGVEYSSTIDLDPLESLNPGSYLVVGAATVLATLDNSIKSIAFSQATNNLLNGTFDAVVLFDRVAMTVIDSVSYEGGVDNATIGGVAGFDLVNGTAATAVDTGQTGSGSIGRQPNGQASGDDDTDWSSTPILTPGRKNSLPPLPGSLVINEIDYDQPGPDDNEFIELYNAGDSTADISLVTLILVSESTNSEYARYDLFALNPLAPGDMVVIGTSNVLATLPNGVQSIETSSFIQNGADGVALVDTESYFLIDALSYETPFITAAVFNNIPGTFNLVSGTGATAVDSGVGSMKRRSDGLRTGDDDSDWILSTTPTPGALEE